MFAPDTIPNALERLVLVREVRSINKRAVCGIGRNRYRIFESASELVTLSYQLSTVWEGSMWHRPQPTSDIRIC